MTDTLFGRVLALVGTAPALVGTAQAFIFVFSAFIVVLIVLIVIVIRWAFRRDKELRRSWTASRPSPKDAPVMNEDGRERGI